MGLQDWFWDLRSDSWMDIPVSIDTERSICVAPVIIVSFPDYRKGNVLFSFYSHQKAGIKYLEDLREVESEFLNVFSW